MDRAECLGSGLHRRSPRSNSMQVWRALLGMVGLGTMIFVSATVRLLASDEATGSGRTAQSLENLRARSVDGGNCARCHRGGRGGS